MRTQCPSRTARGGRTHQCALAGGHDGNHYADGYSWPNIPTSPQVAAGSPPAGRKDDGAKLRWDLVPFEAMEIVVKVLGHGAEKYGEWNWETVPRSADRYFAAAMRHLVAWRRMETRDPESQLPHLAHAACCVLFLLALEQEGLEAAVTRALGQVAAAKGKEANDGRA